MNRSPSMTTPSPSRAVRDWPPSKDGKFIQAWINLKELPGGMMSANQPPYTFGPIPAFTGCQITTNPRDVADWRAQGEPVLAVYTAEALSQETAAPAAQGIDADTLSRLLRYLSDVMETGTPTECVIARTARHIITTPPAAPREVAAAPVQPETAVHQAAGWAAAVAALLKDAGYSVEWSAIDCIRDLIRRAAPVQAAPALHGFIRRRIERAIQESANPTHGGMHLGDGKVRVLGSDLSYLLKWIDAQQSGSAPAASQEGGRVDEPNTDVLVPREPDEALLRPFYGCPPEELRLAWNAMVYIAERRSGRVDESTDGVRVEDGGQQ